MVWCWFLLSNQWFPPLLCGSTTFWTCGPRSCNQRHQVTEFSTTELYMILGCRGTWWQICELLCSTWLVYPPWRMFEAPGWASKCPNKNKHLQVSKGKTVWKLSVWKIFVFIIDPQKYSFDQTTIKTHYLYMEANMWCW